MRDRVLDQLLAAQPALPRIVELDRAPTHSDVLLAHGGKPDAVILIGVLLTANPEHADVKQPHCDGQHRLALEVMCVVERAGETATEPGQQIGEPEHSLELRAVAVLAPARVVEVLAAAGGVNAGGLEMAKRVRTDPNVFPRWGDYQITYACQLLGRVHPSALLIDIAEPATAANSTNPRP